MTPSDQDGDGSHWSDDIWALLVQVLAEQESSVEWVLCRLCTLWQTALGGYDVCAVSIRDKTEHGKFLHCVGGEDPASPNVKPFTTQEGTAWTDTISAKLPKNFRDFKSVKFRSPDRLIVGGILVATDSDIGDDDLIETLKLISARALRDAQGVGTESENAAAAKPRKRQSTVTPATAVTASTAQRRTESWPTRENSDWQTVALDPERLESLAEFAAGAGHEINNPLGTIVGRVQLLLRDETDIDRRQSLSTIGGQAYRVRDMIGDVMLFARPPQPDPEWNSLSDVVEEVLNGFEEELAAGEFEIDVEFARTARVYADVVQLRVALGALVRNAIEAAAARGSHEMQIRATEVKVGRGKGLELTIADNGIGLTDEQRRHLFDPFYSGRQAGRGLGFGLSKTWRIVSNHGGTVDVTTERGWTTFKLTFPDSPD